MFEAEVSALRRKAELAIRLAAQTSDPELKALLCQVAADYQAQAERHPEESGGRELLTAPQSPSGHRP